MVSESKGQASKFDKLVTSIAKASKNRIEYVEKYQNVLMDTIAKRLGNADVEIDIVELVLKAASLFPLIDSSDLVSATPCFSNIGNAHYLELCMAWLDSLDGICENTAISYRKILINCPVDVKVCNSKNETVALIINDKVQELEGGVVAYLDGNEQKTIILPSDKEYTINIEATDIGEMTYTVAEYNLESGGNQKIIGYYEIPIKKGDLLEAEIENMDEVTETEYSLKYEDGKIIKPTIKQNENEIKNYIVTVESAIGGKVTGGGYYVNGEFAKVTAIPDDNYSFKGWYINNSFVSDNMEYRFLVNEDITITAHFEKNDTKNEILRIFGATRYETGIAVADELKTVLGVDKFDTVIIATGKNYADALSGSYLASVKKAPILLTNGKAENIAELHTYIKENVRSGATIYILGGTGAVSETVEAINGYKIVRLAGSTRYETNLAILEEAGYEGQDDLLVATGKSFADSLSASAVARPILLVKPDTCLTDAQKTIAANFINIYVIGGTGAVSKITEEELSAYGIVTRLSGTSRYETSVAVAEAFFTDPEKVVLAYGKNFPDGLCGGALATALNAPLILTKEGNEDVATAYVAANGIRSGYVLGGEGALPNDTVVTVFGLKGADEIIKH